MSTFRNLLEVRRKRTSEWRKMETVGIGAFGVSSFTVGAWAVWFIGLMVASAILYWLSLTAHIHAVAPLFGLFAIITHVAMSALGGCLLVTWWSSSFAVWEGKNWLGAVLGSLLALPIVLAGPLVGRVIATKTNG